MRTLSLSWSGARQGLITSGLSHVAHAGTRKWIERGWIMKQSICPKCETKAWDTNGDGIPSRKELNEWYKNGSGVDILVPAKHVDLKWLTATSLKEGVPIEVQTLYSSETGKLYGYLNLELIPNSRSGGYEKVKIHKDEYDFKMHSYKTNHDGTKKGLIGKIKTFFRNTATKIGNPGPGRSFYIHFSGQGIVRNRYRNR